jgi:hypothetical protein
MLMAEEEKEKKKKKTVRNPSSFVSGLYNQF